MWLENMRRGSRWRRVFKVVAIFFALCEVLGENEKVRTLYIMPNYSLVSMRWF